MCVDMNANAGAERLAYKCGDFAKLAGVSVKTLQRWDREGILRAKRTPTNRRYYTQGDLDKVLGGRGT